MLNMYPVYARAVLCEVRSVQQQVCDFYNLFTVVLFRLSTVEGSILAMCGSHMVGTLINGGRRRG